MCGREDFATPSASGLISICCKWLAPVASCRRSAASTVASLLCSDPAGFNEEGVDRIISSFTVFVAGVTEEGVEDIVPSSTGFVACVTEEGVDRIISSSSGVVVGLAEEGVETLFSSSRGFVAGATEEVVDRSPPPMVLSISNLDASVASMGFLAWLVSVWLVTVLGA